MDDWLACLIFLEHSVISVHIIGSYINTKQHNRFRCFIAVKLFVCMSSFTVTDSNFAQRCLITRICCCNNLFSFNLHFYESEELDIRIRSYLCLVVF